MADAIGMTIGDSDLPLLLTDDQAAKFIGLTLHEFFAAIAKGHIGPAPVPELAPRRLWSRAELSTWAARRCWDRESWVVYRDAMFDDEGSADV